jgi:hypothetical protein
MTRIAGTLHEEQYTSSSIFLRMREFPDHRRENQNTHLMFNTRIFFFENRVIYEITWKNTVEPGRPQMTIRHMRIACWIPKTTNTHSEYAIFIAIPQQQWFHESASALP